jgi:gluconokinase
MPRRAPDLLVLAMDIGSSSTRSVLFDEKGRALAETNACREYSVRYTLEGGAELSPLLLRRAAENCLGETLKARRDSPALRRIPIVAVGASAFWHSLLGVDAKDRPITPVFTWADSRCAADAARLRKEFDERKIHAQTGCMLRASFWPANLRWFRRIQKNIFNRAVRWVSPAEWIFEDLFGASGCSHSMASATGLYDLGAHRWDPVLCEACGIETDQLGSLTDVATEGSTQMELRSAKIFPAIGDGAAGNLGCGADVADRVAINIGTSAALRTMETHGGSVVQPAPFGLFRYAVDRERTVLGGAVSNAGNLRRWCLRELRLSKRDSDAEKILSRTAAASDELTVLPFWVNERAPTWPENLRGAIIGLNQASSASQLLRATTCAVFYRLGEILDLIESATGRSKEAIVSGGILHSRASLRLLADALGRDLRVSSELEASLRGAAVYVLEKLGHGVAPLRNERIVRHDRALARKHRLRRARQVALEKLLLQPAASDTPSISPGRQ